MQQSETISTENKQKQFIENIIDSKELLLAQVDGTIFHKNYLEYLESCWAQHKSVVVDPTFLWHMVLCELAVDIRTHVEDYRPFLTTSNEKQTILIDMSLEGFDIDLFVNRLLPELFNLIPSSLDESIPSNAVYGKVSLPSKS